MSGNHGVALACMSAATLVVPIAWFTFETTRATFQPLRYTNREYIRNSLVFALPALVVVVVAIPAYASTVDTALYTGCAVSFHLCEWLWLAASTVDSVLLSAVILIAAAASLTALVGEGIRSIDEAGGCPGYFLATFLFPLANVWFNDALYYVYGYHASRLAGSEGAHHRTHHMARSVKSLSLQY